MKTPIETPSQPQVGSDALLGPEILHAALQTCTAATAELESVLNLAAADAFAKWHAKWGILLDNVHIKGEPRGLKDNVTFSFDANVKLRWALA